jgi:4-carboxymuconolactone decarboxylase
MPTMPEPLIAPKLPSEWDGAVLDALGAFPSGLQYVLKGWKENGAATRGLNVLGTMAHHPPLAKAFSTFNAHVAVSNTLVARVRELVILRTAWLQHVEYEYVQHVILGRRAGLTDAEMDRVQLGPDAPGWEPLDADCIRAVDELHARSRIKRETWIRLSRHFTVQQLLDVIFLIGCYITLSLAVNSVGMEMEPGAGADPLEPAIRQRLLDSQPATGS